MSKPTLETWNELKSRIIKGQLITGTVIRSERYGLFLDIGESFNGLVLIPFLSKNTDLEFDEYPKTGELVKGKVLDFSDNDHIEHSYVSISLIQ